MRFVRDNLATIVCGILICAFVVASSLITYHARRGASSAAVAVVHDADGHTYDLPLSKDAELRVTTDKGTNVIRVTDGACSMVEADCPSGACLHQRPITRPGEQIICLPHELWIEVTQGSGTTKMDASAVSYADDGDAGLDVDLVAR